MTRTNSRMRALVGLTALATLGGCVSLPKVTSGQIGCPEEQIRISQEDTSINVQTWTATCRGQTYFCSSSGNGQGTPQVACKEAQASTRTSTASGCAYDTQCKGDRICRAGTCVDPT